jgi:type III secretion system low calcium response chaperone LcrH/SycD
METAVDFYSEFVKKIEAGGVLGDMSGITREQYDAVYQIACTLYDRGQYHDAGKLFSFLVVHNHLDRKHLFGYAASMQMTGNYEKALEYFGLAFVLDDDDYLPMFHACECLIALGRVEDARAGLELIIKSSSESESEALRERSSGTLALLAQTEKS